MSPATTSTEEAAVIARLANADRLAAERWAKDTERFGYVGPAPVARTDTELLTAAKAEAARKTQFRASPRGRLVAAIQGLRDLCLNTEAADAYGFYSRSLADEAAPLDLDAVAGIRRVLSHLSDDLTTGVFAALAALVAEAAPAQREAA